MSEPYRYLRAAEHIEYYRMGWGLQNSAPPPSAEQPPLTRDFIAIQHGDPLALAPDAPDIRGFTVQTPDGDPIGQVTGYLADAANSVLAFGYVAIEGGRTVVVPTDQLMRYPAQRLVTLEGGKEALYQAPVAIYDASDAERAQRYWTTYRRRHAA